MTNRIQISRRAGLLAGLAALGPGRAALAQLPDTPALYEAFRRPGDAGVPDASVVIEPVPGNPNIRLGIWLPKNARAASLVIFSHGEFGDPTAYDRLLGHVASHGYVVIAPYHDDRRALTAWTESRAISAVLLEDQAAWSARLDDISRALDASPVISRTTGISIRQDRAMIIGHSLGAFTAQLVLGVRALMSGNQVLQRREPRLYGGIVMSPQGRGKMGLVNGSWDGMAAPTMFMTGPGDVDALGQNAEIKAEPFFLAPAGYRHLAWFGDIKPHLFTSQQSASGSIQDAVSTDTRMLSVAFLEAYVGRRQEVLNTLSTDYYARMARGRFSTSYR